MARHEMNVMWIDCTGSWDKMGQGNHETACGPTNPLTTSFYEYTRIVMRGGVVWCGGIQGKQECFQAVAASALVCGGLQSDSCAQFGSLGLQSIVVFLCLNPATVMQL